MRPALRRRACPACSPGLAAAAGPGPQPARVELGGRVPPAEEGAFRLPAVADPLHHAGQQRGGQGEVRPRAAPLPMQMARKAAPSPAAARRRCKRPAPPGPCPAARARRPSRPPGAATAAAGRSRQEIGPGRGPADRAFAAGRHEEDQQRGRDAAAVPLSRCTASKRRKATPHTATGCGMLLGSCRGVGAPRSASKPAAKATASTALVTPQPAPWAARWPR